MFNNKLVKFIDCVDMHYRHPKTYEIPSVNDIHNLNVGDYVKIEFYNMPHMKDVVGVSERMWLRIESKLDDLNYIGVLSNDPVLFQDYYKYGDVFNFEYKNICSIHKVGVDDAK